MSAPSSVRELSTGEDYASTYVLCDGVHCCGLSAGENDVDHVDPGVPVPSATSFRSWRSLAQPVMAGAMEVDPGEQQRPNSRGAGEDIWYDI
jgi:hypothetical protein